MRMLCWGPNQPNVQGEDVALALAEVLNAWHKGSGAKGTGASLMSLASAFEPLSGPQQPAGDPSARARALRSIAVRTHHHSTMCCSHEHE